MNFCLQLVVGLMHVVVLKNQRIQQDNSKRNEIYVKYARDALH